MSLAYGTAASDYLVSQSLRSTYVYEAWRSAQVTIPAVMPDEQDAITRAANSPARLAKPFQSLGARGVNNLASKLLLTLFPPTAPFMKYELTQSVRDEIEADGGETASDKISELKALLARREGRIQTEVDVQGIRVKVFAILRHLLICGNVLAYADPLEGGIQVFALNSYVARRDGRGTLLDLIYVEKLDRNSLTDTRVADIVRFDPRHQGDSKEPVLLFTRVCLEDGKYESWQEVCDQKVPDSEISYAIDKLPWLALRYTSIDGEDYGRGFVEEYRGDLTSFEQMSRDMLFASANAAKVVWAVDPTSPLKADAFLNAPNGGVVPARKDDVECLQLNKGGDMNVVFQQMRELEKALSADFLLNSSFQRDQERVTAEEIRRMAEELDDTLGGVFSLLSQELQLPLARLLELQIIRKDKGFPALPKDTVRIGVVTGLAAIGRGQDLQRLREAMALVSDMAKVMPGLLDYIDEGDLNTRIWTGSGVDTQGLIKSEKDVTALREQKQQQAVIQNATAEATKGLGTAIGTSGGGLDFSQLLGGAGAPVPQG